MEILRRRFRSTTTACVPSSRRFRRKRSNSVWTRLPRGQKRRFAQETRVSAIADLSLQILISRIARDLSRHLRCLDGDQHFDPYRALAHSFKKKSVCSRSARSLMWVGFQPKRSRDRGRRKLKWQGGGPCLGLSAFFHGR